MRGDENLRLTPDLAGHRDAYLELEALASAPYNDFVFGDPRRSLRVRQALFDDGSAEWAAPHGVLALDGQEPVAMMARLEGRALVRARMRSAVGLARSGVLDEDAGLAARLRLAGGTLLHVRPEDFYLSRLAVADGARGRGLGRLLLEQFLREGQERGFRSFVLEVAAGSAAALALYRSVGFRESGHQAVTDPATGRRLEYLHLGLSE